MFFYIHLFYRDLFSHTSFFTEIFFYRDPFYRDLFDRDLHMLSVEFSAMFIDIVSNILTLFLFTLHIGCIFIAMFMSRF